MKQNLLLILFCLLMLLLSSCAMAANPLANAQSTPVPGLPAPHIATAPSAESTEQMEIQLFFRYQQTGLLACETRAILIPKDESPELAVVRQLLAGPQASHADLVRLFPHNTTVADVSIADDTLMVTLSEGLLNDGLPANWTEDPLWKTEAPLRRQLTIQSLVATLTENFSYTYVQVFIAHEQASNVSTRLDAAYFLDGRSGPTEKLFRDETVLMTMQNTALHILDAWYRRDYEQLYQLTAVELPEDERPFYQDFALEMDTCASLVSYTASAGHAPAGSNRATLTLDLTCSLENREFLSHAVPFRLVQEEGIWRVPYSELKRLMLRTN